MAAKRTAKVKDFKLPIDIIQRGKLKKAGALVTLRPDQIDRIETEADKQKQAEPVSTKEV